LLISALYAMNYASVKNNLGRTNGTNIPFERAFQMEFYSAAVRCTSKEAIVSVDVGSLFSSNGSIDFTVRIGVNFWGFEILREGDRIQEHIARFGRKGRYSSLPLTDYCLVDFRRRPTDGTVDLADLELNENLNIISYDAEFKEIQRHSKHGAMPIRPHL